MRPSYWLSTDPDASNWVFNDWSSAHFRSRSSGPHSEDVGSKLMRGAAAGSNLRWTSSAWSVVGVQPSSFLFTLPRASPSEPFKHILEELSSYSYLYISPSILLRPCQTILSISTPFHHGTSYLDLDRNQHRSPTDHSPKGL